MILKAYHFENETQHSHHFHSSADEVDMSSNDFIVQRAISSREQMTAVRTEDPIVFYKAKRGKQILKTWFSENIKDVTGFDGKRLIEDPDLWLSRVHPDDRESLRNYYENPSSFPITLMAYRWLSRDGTYHWLLERPGFDVEERELDGICIGVLIDITASKRSEVEKDLLVREIEMTSQQLHTISYHLFEKEDSESRYIARELHDELGQSLSALKISLQTAHHQCSENTIRERLSKAIAQTDKMIKQVRALSLDLHLTILEDLDFASALKWLVSRYEFGEDVTVRLFLEEGTHLPLAVAQPCFRIAQEALTNILRHANAKTVELHFASATDHITLSILDDGRGFDYDTEWKDARIGNSLGLISMKERAHLCGGSVTIESEPDNGAKITAVFPLRKNSSGLGVSKDHRSMME